MTYCEQKCGGMSVYDASCSCHEAARDRLIQTETPQRGASGVRVTPKRKEGK